MNPQVTLKHLITKKVILKAGITVHRHFFEHERRTNDPVTVLIQLYDEAGQQLNETSFPLKKIKKGQPAGPWLQLDDLVSNVPKTFRYRTRNNLLRVSDVVTGTFTDQFEDQTSAGPIA